MRSTTDVDLFFRARLSGMNRPVLAERPRSVNRDFLLAMREVFPRTRRTERGCGLPPEGRKELVPSWAGLLAPR
jgi:hypothetical protein